MTDEDIVRQVMEVCSKCNNEICTGINYKVSAGDININFDIQVDNTAERIREAIIRQLVRSNIKF